MEIELPESASIWIAGLSFLIVVALQFMRRFDCSFHEFSGAIFLVIECSSVARIVAYKVATNERDSFLGDFEKMNMWRSVYIASTVITLALSLYLVVLRIYFHYRSKAVRKSNSE
jgi:hypothetical protein